MDHVYSADEAKRVLDTFPSDKLSELLKLAKRAKLDPQVVESHETVSLPEGWVYELCGNCIFARYQDGEQERKEFYSPQIYIEFMFTGKIEAKKSIVKRPALGYCSCGKRMPVVQGLLWAGDMIDRKGFSQFPARAVGYIVSLPLAVWVMLRPIQQYSLMFNRHPKCL